MLRMRVTFLGTGTSHGIPVIGCDCAVCRSTDLRDQRLRPSVVVETGQGNVLIDATPDFRTQALRANLRRVDAVLLTHTHADHILGLDDLRVYTWKSGGKMPLYGSAESLAIIERMFPYACTPTPRWPGLPSFELHAVTPEQEFAAGGVGWRALPLLHGGMPVFGFQAGRDFGYVTDCNVVPAEVVAALRGVTVLVLDGLRERAHPTHLTISQAVELAHRIQPKLTLLTHMCHEAGHQSTEDALPADVRLAYDGMRIEIGNGSWSMVHG